MRVRVLTLASIMFCVPALASSDVQISEVGLKGYFSASAPSPVTVAVKVPSGVDSIKLDFTASLKQREEITPMRVDHFSARADVKGGELAQITVPLLLPGWYSDRSTLTVDVSDFAGHKIGSSSVDLNAFRQLPSENLVAIFCTEHTACDEAQSQISFSGSQDEVASKNQNFKFVALQLPREHWFEYTAAKFVVVAGAVAGWTPAQRFALEGFVRSGGTVMLLEKECSDPAFLAPYRAGPINGLVRIGKGRLHRVGSLQSKELGPLFAGKNLQTAALPIINNFTPDPLRRELAVSFDFPRLRWFILWLAVYILIVGVGNFGLLRRFHRVEWGWVTTTAIAVLFAIGFYFVSSRNRPRQVTLDNIAVYWMDDKSPNAWENIGLRVSSPERQQLDISVGDDAFLASSVPVNSGVSNADIATEITREQQLEPGWEVQLGPPIQTALSLFRWSFSDLDLQTFHKFAGTVTIDQGFHLKNATGQPFREALYLDFEGNKMYEIPSLGDGEQVDLNTLEPSPIWSREHPVRGEYTVGMYTRPADASQKPWHLKNLPYSGFDFNRARRVFVGLSDAPVPPVTIPGTSYVQHNFALTVVAMDQP